MSKNKMAKNTKRIIKETRQYSDTELELKSFIKIMVMVILLALIIYFLSVIVVNKRENSKKEEPIAGEVSYSKVTVGTMLNRPYDTYYVFAYSKDSNKYSLYSSISSAYEAGEDATKVYYLDTSSLLNSNYVAKDETEVNTKARDIEDIKFGEVTLIKVSKGKITNYYSTLDEIKNILK